MSPPAMHFEEQISGAEESIYQKGVKYLCQETGSATIKKVPGKYILPVSDRPNLNPNPTLNLPVIDFAELLGPNRTQVIKSLHKACQEFGFFQVYLHSSCLTFIFILFFLKSYISFKIFKIHFLTFIFINRILYYKFNVIERFVCYKK